MSGPAVDLDAHRGVEPGEFRRALGSHAAGVVVVTGTAEGEPVGLTATSFSSVSLDPPLVSFYASHGTSTGPRLLRSPWFAINVLAEGQHELAARFARRGEDRFAGTAWRLGEQGVPLLEGAAARLVCRRGNTVDIGDHSLVVGLVTAAEVADLPPLLYLRGGFGRFTA
ncbi:flavin reductase family protein [Actinocorallia populi]|uniref:flavin reductase family protein n=1 Tax=Actinocorallia populi TaxID=2079200 RepID=UPI000D088F7B|nr:flavin reductase family protein [Actinocorallia populi]